MDAHEMSGGVAVQFLDDPLSKFLNEMEKEKLLDDTFIIFVSDHGNHMHYSMEIYLNQQFIDERLLPLLIISVP